MKFKSQKINKKHDTLFRILNNFKTKMLFSSYYCLGNAI